LFLVVIVVQIHSMRRITLIALALLLSAAVATPAIARPGQGFNKGPYLAIEGGIAEVKYDHDETSVGDSGRNFDPAFGFMFGWNAWDWLSAELQGRYSTSVNAGHREHIAAANLYAKAFLITNALTDFPTLRILPFIKGGLGIHVGVLPGSTGSTDTKVTTVGVGPSLGGGLAFTWKKYVYFGLDVQEDLIFFEDTRQDVNGVPGTTVYKGGFYPSLGAMGFIGVHY